MKSRWLPTTEAAKQLETSRQYLWKALDRARNVQQNGKLVMGEHWRHDGSRYLINVDHPMIKEVFHV